MDLRQSTAGQVITIGQALDSADGDSENNGLTIANTDIKIHKHNTTVLANKNSGGATNISNGVYHLTLDATDTNTAGRLVIYVHVASVLALKAEFNVLTATAFDAKYTGTFNNLGGVAQSADNDTKISAISTVVPPSVAQLNARTLLSDNYFDFTTDQVIVTTNNDKSGYALTVTPPTAVQNRQEMDSNSVDLNSIISNQTTINANILLIDTAPMRGTDSAFLAANAPTNFSDLAIAVTSGEVTVGTNNDKTGYSLSQAFPTNFSVQAISVAGDVSSDINKINGVTIVGDGSATPFDV